MLDEQDSTSTDDTTTETPADPAVDTPGDAGGDTPAPAKKAAKKAAKKSTAKRAAKKTAAAEPAEATAVAGDVEAPAAAEGDAAEAPAAKRTAKKAAAKKTAKKAAAKKTTKKTTAKRAGSSAPDAGDDAAPADTVDGTVATQTTDTTGPSESADATDSAAAGGTSVLFRTPDPVPAARATAQPAGDEDEEAADEEADDDSEDSEDSEDSDDSGSDDSGESDDTEGQAGGNRRRRRRGGRRRRRSGGGGGEGGDAGGDASSDDAATDEESTDAEETDQSDEGGRGSAGQAKQGGRQGGGRQSSKQGGKQTGAKKAAGRGDAADSGDADDTDESGEGGSRRRRRRRRTGDDSGGNGDDPQNTVTRVRKGRTAEDEITSLSGSTRLEAKKQRRREGREAGRRRAPIVSEAEFLARREAVDRVMVIRQREDLTQIAVLEDKVLVEHYVARESQTSLIGNVYLGRVQNVLPSMEAAFIDIGKGRNAVLYAGEVNWDALGAGNGPRKIEQVLKSGQQILVQVTKDPIGHKGARLTSQVSLPGRFLVYVPDGTTSGISRKLPDTERSRLKSLLKEIVPESAGVIVRTAAEGASEEELTRDVERLTARWSDIEAKVAKGNAPQLLYGEPDLTLKVVRDLFTEDFGKLVVSGDEAWDMVDSYVQQVAPELEERLERYDEAADRDVFAAYRIDEQIAKGLDRKVWLPSGGSLIIDRTEAMTVVDVNTGKFTGSGGNLEETVTKNNLEAAEEIVRQLRLRDIGGIIVVDFIDMVLENNRDLVLRRLVECLGRDRTRHQVAEVTSLGLVQMTRKRIGTGLLEAFSETCEHCGGRGLLVHHEPVEPKRHDDEPRRGRRGRNRGESSGASQPSGKSQGNGNGNGTPRPPTPADLAAMAKHEPRQLPDDLGDDAGDDSSDDLGGDSSRDVTGGLADDRAPEQSAEPLPAVGSESVVDAPAGVPAPSTASGADGDKASPGADATEPVAEPVAEAEPVAQPEPVAEPEPEPAPAVPAQPRLVTSTRRRVARRPAGPPAHEPSTGSPNGSPDGATNGGQPGTGAEVLSAGTDAPLAEDLDATDEHVHVPVKKKGRRR